MLSARADELLDGALRLWRELRARGEDDAVSWNAAAQACLSGGDPRRGLAVLEAAEEDAEPAEDAATTWTVTMPRTVW